MKPDVIQLSEAQAKAERDAGIVRVSMEDLMRVWSGQASVEDLRRDAMHEENLDDLRRWDTAYLRRFWDEVGDNSYYEGPEGKFDCADIHRVLNERGDGAYCAV